MKPSSLLAVFLFFTVSSGAQTIFSYAGKNVSTAEYLKAFNKVHPAPVKDKPAKMREYLDLYINSKLKIHEAELRGYDTTPGFKEEFSALRNQVLENYMNDTESLDALVSEAFDRSQKDIKVQHIFIPYVVDFSFSDSAVAKLKIQEALMELKSGKSFDDVALKFSADPSVAENKGHLGYLTVFSLPYQFENIIYNLSPGQYSAPHKSNSGYHIFKNIAERKAVGRIRAAQILIAIPPGSDDNAKKRLATLADSLYNRIQKGDDFSMLARSFSNDVMSATSGGSMQEFGIGSFDPAFENVVFALPANGTISKPFLTNHGYHIVKRISLTTPPTVKDKKNLDLIRQLVETDGRINVAKERMFNKMLSKTGYTEYQYDQQMLKQFLDSVLSGLPPSPSNPVTKSTALFKIGATQKLAGDFATYAVSNRYRTDGSGLKTYTVLFDEYKRNTVMQYYRDHLEEYNEDFNRQMKELKDGNLFFDIMMREIWSQAQSDTSGQKDFFTRNKAKYTWQQSADAVMFYCGDEETAGIFKMQLGKNPGLWKETLEMYSDKVTSDSSRFDTKKIPGFPKTVNKPGFLTATIVNKEDKTASFAYVFKYYTQPAAKTFDEARGDVIADYQEALDKKWITDLKKKYPVKVNEEELKKLLK